MKPKDEEEITGENFAAGMHIPELGSLADKGRSPGAEMDMRIMEFGHLLDHVPTGIEKGRVSPRLPGKAGKRQKRHRDVL